MGAHAIPAIRAGGNLEGLSSVEDCTHFFEVRIDIFDGPIDLLLHLVKKHELEIEKVSLAQVATQYFECLERMRELDLEVAGEYLVIAATLLSIKSSVLLDEPPEMVIDEDGNVLDPHEELLARLREAQVYRDGARYLGARELLGVDVFSPPPGPVGIEPLPVRYRDHDPMLLGMAFRRLLDRVGSEQPGLIISVDSVSIVERMVGVLDTLRARGGSAPFEELIPDRTSRASMISSFLALLELCKRQAIVVRQSRTFDQIVISLVGSEQEVSEPLASEFDESKTGTTDG